jgi:DNA-binding IclR family transcriptional regulator
MATVESVARALKIIESLAMSPAGLSETARRVELPKSTVARLLSTLEDFEAVERDDDGRTYRLGPMVQRLSTAAGGPAQFAGFARPYLEELTEATGEAAGVSIPDVYEVHYIGQTDAKHPVQVRDWTGELIPMHVVPSGLAIMAHWPDKETDRFLKRELKQLTSNTVTDPEAIRQRLLQTRKRGHVWGYEEFVEGINSVAAPVLEKGGMVTGAIHVHGPAYRFPGDEDDNKIGEAVAEAARRLSEAMAL